MNALQVTPLPHIPDDDGFFVRGKLEKMGRQPGGLPSVPKGIGWFDGSAIEFRNSDHTKSAFSIRLSAIRKDGLPHLRVDR